MHSLPMTVEAFSTCESIHSSVSSPCPQERVHTRVLNTEQHLVKALHHYKPSAELSKLYSSLAQKLHGSVCDDIDGDDHTYDDDDIDDDSDDTKKVNINRYLQQHSWLSMQLCVDCRGCSHKPMAGMASCSGQS